MNALPDITAEWLEADGLGGFASGTVGGERTRRYHALLLAATNPPSGRMVLVNGLDAIAYTPAGEFPVSTQRYWPGTRHPDGATRIVAFTWEPWPRWTFQAGDGILIEQELFVRHGSPLVVVRWSLKSPAKGVMLNVRPFLSGRDYHSMHHENGGFNFNPELSARRATWRPYPGVPEINVYTNGTYQHAPHWYRHFMYEEELRRGLDATEDLATPGVFTFDLSAGEAVMIISTPGGDPGFTIDETDPAKTARHIRRDEEKRRAAFPSPLHRAADSYLVKRGKGKTIVAGYPWFTDWGRDAFIALRGICLATGRLDEARDILVEWAGVVSEGMLPNLFPDGAGRPEYNSVDASLWYIIAVHEYLEAEKQRSGKVPADVEQTLQRAVDEVLTGYANGTRFGIRRDNDGLLACGVQGVQLTWMDAKVGDWVVTPRIGKPVEIQALWLNALRIGANFSQKWKALHDEGLASFQKRFWNEDAGCLYDVVDDNHETGRVDASIRPNQVFAIGGLPYQILTGRKAVRALGMVDALLLTPIGLRSLAPQSPGYCPRYEGGVLQRDGAYHQGTIWPWLIGAFVEAWLRTNGGTKEEAARHFLPGFEKHLATAGLGHVSEIADAEPPFTPRGCPFQAWSLAEHLRLRELVLKS